MFGFTVSEHAVVRGIRCVKMKDGFESTWFAFMYVRRSDSKIFPAFPPFFLLGDYFIITDIYRCNWLYLFRNNNKKLHHFFYHPGNLKHHIFYGVNKTRFFFFSNYFHENNSHILKRWDFARVTFLFSSFESIKDR